MGALQEFWACKEAERKKQKMAGTFHLHWSQERTIDFLPPGIMGRRISKMRGFRLYFRRKIKDIHRIIVLEETTMVI